MTACAARYSDHPADEHRAVEQLGVLMCWFAKAGNQYH
jgi:hypothetical protein